MLVLHLPACLPLSIFISRTPVLLIVAAFVKTLNNVERVYAPGGYVPKDHTGRPLGVTATLKEEQLVTVALEFGKVQDAEQQTHLKTAGADPFAGCLICAAPERMHLDDGEFQRHTAYTFNLLPWPRHAGLSH